MQAHTLSVYTVYTEAQKKIEQSQFISAVCQIPLAFRTAMRYSSLLAFMASKVAMIHRWQTIRKWLTPGLGIKRWLLLLIIGITIISVALAQVIVAVYRDQGLPDLVYYVTLRFLPLWLRIVIGLLVGVSTIGIAVLELNRSILAPFAGRQHGAFIDVKYNHSFQQRGLKVVALGGGTGLPAVLRALKTETSNLTAIVTMADDGGSSGKLRRELGVLPPGDLRNNIAALADDENLMTQLFQYRFGEGGLEGHSFGNLFITALANITGSMDRALAETGNVLAIQGRVLPSTLQDVTLIAEIRSADGKELRRVIGESQIPLTEGTIERVIITPENARAYPESVRAILAADVVVIGPGSLFTSILPNLLINGIPEAIRANNGLHIYVCNVATQEGETTGFNVADHILALERNVGRGLFNIVLANSSHPNAEGTRTQYVAPLPADHELRQRYEIHEIDLTDPRYPWRHSPAKLSGAILGLALRPQSMSPLPVETG
jgi:uncharacterized cofD-like protein